MRKFLTYLLLSVYLLSFSEVKQVVKFPLLIEHYVEHTIKDPSTTLYSFIKMHYLDKQVKDADYQEDMRLPFKTMSPTFISIHFNNHQNLLDMLGKHELPNHHQKQSFFYSEPSTSTSVTEVFRPPVIS